MPEYSIIATHPPKQKKQILDWKTYFMHSKRVSAHKPPTMSQKKPRIQKYAEAVAVGNTRTRAKELAGYSPKTNVTDIEQNPVFKSHQKAILNKFEAGGLTDDLVVKRLKGLINKREKRLSFGKVVEVDKVDAGAVSKGLDLLFKVRGDYAPVEVKQTNPMDDMDIVGLMTALQEAGGMGEVSLDLLPELTDNPQE